MFLKSHFCNLNKILYCPNIFFNCQILLKMVKKIIFGTKNNYYNLAFQVKSKKKLLYFSWTFPMESPNSKKFLLLIIMTEEKTVASFGVCSLLTKIPQQITLHKSYIIQLYIFLWCQMHLVKIVDYMPPNCIFLQTRCSRGRSLNSFVIH